jgi:hypothetical protein
MISRYKPTANRSILTVKQKINPFSFFKSFTAIAKEFIFPENF